MYITLVAFLLSERQVDWLLIMVSFLQSRQVSAALCTLVLISEQVLGGKSDRVIYDDEERVVVVHIVGCFICS